MVRMQSNSDSKNSTSHSRLNFLKQSGVAASVLTLGGILVSCRRGQSTDSGTGPAIKLGNKNYKWSMVTTWPKNFPGLGTGANRLARRIEEMSRGRIKIKVLAAGERVPPLEVFDAVRTGTADLGHGAAYYWKGKTRAAQFFAAVPFGLNAQEMAAWIRFGGGQELWDALYADFGLKPFACGNTGVQMGGWFNKEINSLSDFKGLKMRMPGLGGEVLSHLGASAPNIPGGEIFESLRSGVIDATEWVGPYNDLAFGFYKAARYYYWPGWHEPGTALELLINRKLYETLPDDLQAILHTACQADYNEMLAEFTARNNHALQVLINKYKVQLRKFPDHVLKALGIASLDVVASIASDDTASMKVYTSFQKFRGQSIDWARIGEEGFSLARAMTANK